MEPVEILLVEDNAGDAVLIRQILAEARVAVNLHIARDGEQAMAMMSEGLFEPKLVILDLNIPRITGPALLERWKSLDVPVVVFSSSLNESEHERVLALGAREFIQKPADVDAFSAAIDGIIERYAGPDSQRAGGVCA